MRNANRVECYAYHQSIVYNVRYVRISLSIASHQTKMPWMPKHNSCAMLINAWIYFVYFIIICCDEKLTMLHFMKKTTSSRLFSIVMGFNQTELFIKPLHIGSA